MTHMKQNTNFLLEYSENNGPDTDRDFNLAEGNEQPMMGS